MAVRSRRDACVCCAVRVTTAEMDLSLRAICWRKLNRLRFFCLARRRSCAATRRGITSGGEKVAGASRLLAALPSGKRLGLLLLEQKLFLMRCWGREFAGR